MWLLTGALIGWLTYSFFGYNVKRGLAVSIVIGATGAIVGGRVLAPMVFDAAPGELSAALLAFAAAVAGVFVLLGNLAEERWGF